MLEEEEKDYKNLYKCCKYSKIWCQSNQWQSRMILWLQDCFPILQKSHSHFGIIQWDLLDTSSTVSVDVLSPCTRSSSWFMWQERVIIFYMCSLQVYSSIRELALRLVGNCSTEAKKKFNRLVIAEYQSE